MYVEYLLYLKTLTEGEKNKQVISIVSFWVILIVIGLILYFVKKKFKDKYKWLEKL